MFRRKRGSSHQPINPNPSPSAQSAAAQAFRASQANAIISTAAAAAALRKHTPTPTAVEDVQTKRMLQRQRSNTSIGGGKGTARRNQNERLQRSGSSGSMTTRTFREQSPAGLGPIGSSPEIMPVPPLPENYTTPTSHRRTSSLEPPYQAISPPGRTGQGRGAGGTRAAGPSSPSSIRSRTLSSLPELERRSSRGSVNFSYPTHARPNSPPQSPPRNFVPQSPLRDDAALVEERSVRSPASVRTPSATTSPVGKATKELHSVTGIHRRDPRYDDLDWSPSWREHGRGSAEAEQKVEREAKDFTQPYQTGAAHIEPDTHSDIAQSPQTTKSTNLQRRDMAHGISPEPDFDYIQRPKRDTRGETDRTAPQSELHIPKQRTFTPPDDREAQRGDSQAESSHPCAYDVSGHNLDVRSTRTDPSSRQQLDGAWAPTEASQRYAPVIDTSVPITKDSSSTPSDGQPQAGVQQPTRSNIGDQHNDRPHSLSPSRTTRFSSHLAVPLTGEKIHDPPPRSMSPAKSALKQPTSQSHTVDRNATQTSKSAPASSETSEGTSTESEDGRQAAGKRRAPKVSFEDEPEVVGTAASPPVSPDSPVAFSPQWNGHDNRFSTGNGYKEHDIDEVMKPRPALPSFGSIRGRRGLTTDNESQHRRREYSPPRSFANDQAFGGTLYKPKHTRNQDPISLRPGDPLPPEVTSVEGTGYESMSEESSSSDDIVDPHDFIPLGDSITSFGTSEMHQSHFDTSEPVNEGKESDQSRDVPVISVQPATPALNGGKGSIELKRIPGRFPSPLPPQEQETTTQGTQPLRPTTPDATLSQDPATPDLIEHDEESDESGESIYSDAAEDWSEMDGDGFGSINAIVESPISHVSNTTHTSPPESPTRSQTIVSHHNEPRTSSPFGYGSISSTLPAVKEDPSPRRSSLNKEDRPQNHLGSHPQNPELPPTSHQPGSALTPVTAGGVASSAEPVSLHENIFIAQPTSVTPREKRVGDKQKTAKSKSASQTPSDAPARPYQEPRSRMTRVPRQAKQPLENGHINTASSTKPLDFGFAPKSLIQPPLSYDSDSSSSFKRTRRSPRNTGRYNLKRTMRASSDVRPLSSGMPANNAGRPVSPPDQRRPFSSGSSSSMRTTLRGPGRAAHAKSSSFAGLKQSTKLNKVPGLNPNAGAKFKSRFGNPSGLESKRAHPFRSRYADSSDDDLADMKLSPVRGIPKRQGEVNGDSTDLEDSSDNEAPQKVLRRGRPNRTSILPTTHTRSVSTPVTNVDNAQPTTDKDRRTSLAPDEVGDMLDFPKKHRSGLLNRLSLSKRRGNADNKIRKSELDSAARRDTPLERSRFELQRVKNLNTNKSDSRASFQAPIIPEEPVEKTVGGVSFSSTRRRSSGSISHFANRIGSSSWPLRHHANGTTSQSPPPAPTIPEDAVPQDHNPSPDSDRPHTSDGVMKNAGHDTSASFTESTEPPNWTSRFRPRLHARRGTNSTIDEFSPVSTQSDAGVSIGTAALGRGGSTKKKFPLLRKALGMAH
ncbi:hypothetical protein FQN50_008890 [Emmonsiellopsis sp. PD_5]|nr:hypothetical protein FQN50_008890 [Emmonsiellopsis sp. PD_5]